MQEEEKKDNRKLKSPVKQPEIIAQGVPNQLQSMRRLKSKNPLCQLLGDFNYGPGQDVGKVEYREKDYVAENGTKYNGYW